MRYNSVCLFVCFIWLGVVRICTEDGVSDNWVVVSTGVSFKYYCQPISGTYTKMICWKKIERGAMEDTRRSLCMFGSIFEIQTDTFDFVHVARQIKRKELTMLWNMQALTFLRRPASARIIWSIWHVHARYCTLCHVIPRALYSAACFAFLIPTAGGAMLRLEAPRRAQSCSGFSVF